MLILAGGKSQRFQSKPLQGLRVSPSGACGGTGRARDGTEPHNKCFIILNNKPLIQHTIDRASSIADEIIVAARDEKQGEQIEHKIPQKIILVFDSLKDAGPLAGLLSGLESASFSLSLVIGCDMPFVSRDVAKFLFEIASTGYDAVVPRWGNGLVEPLHAVYRKKPMLAAIKEATGKGERRIFDVLSRLKNIYFVSVKEIKEIDPSLKTFININTPEELNKIQISRFFLV